MTLHPQAAAHLAETTGAPGVAAMTVPEARLAVLGYLDMQRPSPEGVEVEHRFVVGPTADLPVRIMRARKAPLPAPAVIVLHGSGWVIGNIDLVDEPAAVLARDTGFAVVTVNYQKAPEHRFPTPLDDCVAAIRWVHDNAAELGVDPTRIAVIGDSAGGNLAAAATAELRAAGVPIAAQALIYPPLDRLCESGSYLEFASGYGLDAADMKWFWEHYVDEDLADDPRVSPLRAADFSVWPATFVATAGYDVLRDEGESYAAKLRRAGVPVTAKRYDGAIHGFYLMDAVLDESRELQRDLARFLVDVLGGS